MNSYQQQHQLAQNETLLTLLLDTLHFSAHIHVVCCRLQKLEKLVRPSELVAKNLKYACAEDSRTNSKRKSVFGCRTNIHGIIKDIDSIEKVKISKEYVMFKSLT